MAAELATRAVRSGWPLTPRLSPTPLPARVPERGRSPNWPERPPRPATWIVAEALARAITDPGIWVWALAEVARVVAEAGDLDRAEALARTITEPGTRPGRLLSWPAWPPRPAIRGA